MVTLLVKANVHACYHNTVAAGIAKPATCVSKIQAPFQQHSVACVRTKRPDLYLEASRAEHVVEPFFPTAHHSPAVPLRAVAWDTHPATTVRCVPGCRPIRRAT